MVETLSSPRIEQFIFQRMGLVSGGLTRFPDSADYQVAPDAGIVYRELTTVPIQVIGGHVTMVRAFWLAFVYGKGTTRYALRTTADDIVDKVLTAPIQVVDGWTIQAVDIVREHWLRTQESNAAEYSQLGGEFKLVASRAP